MALPGPPPATTVTAVFKDFWQDTSDTAADHETRIGAVEAAGSGALEIEDWTDLGNLGATETITGADDLVRRRKGTLDQACAITITLTANQQLDLLLAQDATGGRAATFTGVDTWATSDGNAPDLSTRAASEVDRFRFEDIGGTTFGYWITEPPPAAVGGGVANAGPPMPWTHDPGVMSASNRVLGAANRCIYQRVQGAGTISKIRMHIGTSSGNISVAVYSGSGSGATAVPGTRLATSGSVASPGTGAREISLGASVDVDSTCWIALSADNNTVSFSETNRGNSNALQAGLAGYQASAHPCPSPPSMTQSDGTVALEIILIGVP